MEKINPSEIHLGDMFSDNVFFNDGVSMFLGKNKPIKVFHIKALIRWKIPYLLSDGTKIPHQNEDDAEILEEL